MNESYFNLKFHYPIGHTILMLVGSFIQLQSDEISAEDQVTCFPACITLSTSNAMFPIPSVLR